MSKEAEARQKESEVALLAEKLFVRSQLTPQECFEAAELFILLKQSRWEALCRQ